MRRFFYSSAVLTSLLPGKCFSSASAGALLCPTPVRLASKNQKNKGSKKEDDGGSSSSANSKDGVNTHTSKEINLGDFYDTSLDEAPGRTREMFVPSLRKFAAFNRVLSKKFGVNSMRRLNRKQLSELERVIDMRFLLDSQNAMTAVPTLAAGSAIATRSGRRRSRGAQQRRNAAVNEGAPRYVDDAVFQLPLHEMETIDPALIQSLKNHNRMFLFGNADRLVKSSVVPLHTTFISELLGNVVYLKVLHLPPHLHKAAQHSAAYTAEVERVQRQLLKFILAKVVTPTYSARHIAPFKNEACFDVSLYCAITPSLRAAARHVQQFEDDAAELQRHFADAKQEIWALEADSGKESLSDAKQHKIITDHLFHHNEVDAAFRALAPKKKTLGPYALDAIIGEVALRMRKEAMLPFSASYKEQHHHRDEGNAHSPNVDDFHLCVGIANTPFFAKLACDMEAKRQLERGKTSALPNQVFVQSFCNRVRTVKDAVSLMAPMPFRQLPTISHAFATEVLEGVFGVTTCAEFEKKKEELCFSLSKETFEHCYAATYGRLHFKEEDEARVAYPQYFQDAPDAEDSAGEKRQEEMRARGMTTTFSERIQNSLYHTSYVQRYQKALAPLAHNNIQLYNAKKTAVRPTFREFTKSNLDVFYNNSIQNNASYGRLISDSVFASIVERTTFFTYKKLVYEGLCCGTVRVDLLRNYKTHVTTLSFPLAEPTNRFPDIWQQVKEKALPEMQQKRQRSGAEPTGDIFTLSVMFLKLTLDPTVMPSTMRQELRRVEKQYIATKHAFSRSEVFVYLRSHARTGRGRPFSFKAGKVQTKAKAKAKESKAVPAVMPAAKPKQKKTKAKTRQPVLGSKSKANTATHTSGGGGDGATLYQI